MALTHRQLEAFQVFMEMGTVTASADRLRVSQPAMSKILAGLEYDLKLKEAHVESQRILDQARANASRLEAELRAKAEEQSQRIIERAQETINAERDRALQSLRGEVGGLAVDLATRVVGESLDRERQLRLVDQYINDLASQNGASH